MRKINKGTPLPKFNGANYNGDCFDWNCFHKKYQTIFQDTRLQILIDEQNSLCGYTEIYINKEEECHIDHYVKKSLSPNLTFDWDNLVVATRDSDFGANYKDSTYNIQRVEYTDIYNPVTDTITFTYDSFGAIVEEEGKVQKTVEVFNLNCESLKRRRAGIITTIQTLLKEGHAIDDIKMSLKDVGFLSVVEQELNI